MKFFENNFNSQNQTTKSSNYHDKTPQHFPILGGLFLPEEAPLKESRVSHSRTAKQQHWPRPTAAKILAEDDVRTRQ